MPKEIAYLKLVSGEDLFCIIDLETLTHFFITFEHPYVLKILGPGTNSDLGMHETSIEFAMRWCPYAKESIYNNIYSLSASFVMKVLKPEDDMIERYSDWLMADGIDLQEILTTTKEQPQEEVKEESKEESKESDSIVMMDTSKKVH